MILRIKKTVWLTATFYRLLLFFSLFFLVLVKFGLFSVEINGAQRWISLFGIQFQPSELANIAVIFYLAHFFKTYPTIKKPLWQPLLIVGSIALLILFQPKVAGFLILLILSVLLFSVVGLPIERLLLLIGIGIFSFILFYYLILFLGSHGWIPSRFQHVYDRVRILQNPFLEEYGSGYQMSRSYVALHHGGLWGQGLGNSTSKNGFLPVPETDFIFSIISEELGLVRAIGFIALLMAIYLRLFILGARQKNQQEGLILLGVGTLLLLQTVINLASILGVIPMTGVPLPFISYGGTSYLMLSFGLAICLKLAGKNDSLVDK